MQFSFETAAAALNATSAREAWKWLRSRLNAIDADHVSMVYNFPTRKLSKRFADQSEILGTMISPQWHAAMKDNPEWVFDDPVLPKALSSDNAIFTDTDRPETLAKNASQRRYIRRFRDFGKRLGVGIPIHNRVEGSMSVFLFGWQLDGKAPNEQYIKAIEGPVRQLANYFNEGLLLRSRIDDASNFLISRRESECLSWAAIGKSTSEIADILSLADSTVNAYITSATKKLGASNRTQACTRAFLLSIISP